MYVLFFYTLTYYLERYMNVLLIDWSTIAYPSWEKMARKDYIAETGSEIVEFTRNIAKEAYYLTQRFAPNPDDLVYFLLDSKNWRVPYYDSYYRKFFKAWRVRNKQTKATGYFFTYDTYTYLLWDNHEPKGKELKLQDLKLSPKKLKELKPGLQRKEIEEPWTIERLKPWIPRYKGNRDDRKWTYDTSKETFKELRNKSAYSLGRTLNAKVIEIPGCEADDLVYAASIHHSADNIICVSSDGDLDQIQNSVMFFRRWSPETARRCFMDITPAAAGIKQNAMILCGQPKDNIKPVTMGKTTIGKKKAYTIAEDVLNRGNVLNGPYTEHHSFKRNLKLVSLQHVPEKYLDLAAAGIKKGEVPEGEANHIKNYGLDKPAVMSTRRSAQTHREENP